MKKSIRPGSRRRVPKGQTISIYPLDGYPSWMDNPDIIALGELAIGDCFCFAGRRSARLPGEYIPQWKVLKIAPDFCEAVLKNVPGTAENTTFPGLPVRLSSSTRVYRADLGRDGEE